MTSLHDINRQLVAWIDERPVGSASRFALMDAAEAVSRAIEAEAREAEKVNDTTQKEAAA